MSPQSSSATMRARPPLVRQGSMDRERVTIAPIAPTILKTIGVGNNLASIREGHSHVPKEVELVYVPPSNSIYSLPSTPNMGVEDIHHHPESYFSVGGPSTIPSRHSPLIHNAYLGPSQYDNTPTASSSRQYPSSPHHTVFNHHAFVDSPQIMMEEPSANPDAYDYFGGPDLGEDFSHPSRKRQRTHDIRDNDIHNEDITSHSDVAADSIPMARSISWRPSPSPSPTDTPRQAGTDMPVVVVNKENGAVEKRQEHSWKSSPSQSPVVHRVQEQERAPSPPRRGAPLRLPQEGREERALRASRRRP